MARFSAKACRSASVYLNAAYSFRMDGFIFCAERLMDELMFYQCPRPLRKCAAPAIRVNDDRPGFDSSNSLIADYISITSCGIELRMRGCSDRIDVRDEREWKKRGKKYVQQ